MTDKKDFRGEKNGALRGEGRAELKDSDSTISKPLKKELILRLPDEIFKVIKQFKDISGISYTNFILTAIVWYMIMKGMISYKYTKEEKK